MFLSFTLYVVSSVIYASYGLDQDKTLEEGAPLLEPGSIFFILAGIASFISGIFAASNGASIHCLVLVIAATATTFTMYLSKCKRRVKTQLYLAPLLAVMISILFLF